MIKVKIFILLAVLGLLTIISMPLSAHGYVVSPASRGYQGSLEKNSLGYAAATAKYGAVIYEPQSLEALKGFPGAGPADGRIASANGALGGDLVLDNQTADRWIKTNISTGVNSFVWKYTAYHKTAKWHYYMTKPGWNPNKPLARADLELIGEITHNGTPPTDNTPHYINIPQNRQGYHVIVAIWDIADTVNAFYNVIDVNVTSSTGPLTPPGVPTGLAAENITSSSAKITWTPQPDATSYIVFRNDQTIQEVNTPAFQDQGLLPSTLYTYKVQAKGSSGLTSAKSAGLAVQTNNATTIEKPTAPTNLHSMGVTESSVSLMWGASTHTQGIKNYQVFRNGAKIAETTQTEFLNTGLSSNTEYTYTVKAVALNDQLSDASNELKAKTKQTDNGSGQTYCGAQIYKAASAYPTPRTKVFYSCKIWENKWYANPNELPGTNAVWEEVSGCTEGPNCTPSTTYCGAQLYSTTKTYSTAGTKVFYACKIWQNKWYANPGETPGQSTTWQFLSNCSEGPDCNSTKSSNQDVQEDALTLILTNSVINLSPENYYEKINELTLFDTRGIRVASFRKPAKNSMNISFLQSGIYFVKILYSDGRSITKTIKK